MSEDVARALAVAAQAVSLGDSLSRLALADLCEEHGLGALAERLRSTWPVSRAVFKVAVPKWTRETRRWDRTTHTLIRNTVDHPEAECEVTIDVEALATRCARKATANVGGTSSYAGHVKAKLLPRKEE